MYIQNMLHLDDKVLDGILYRSCSDYDDDSITPSVNINEIEYSLYNNYNYLQKMQKIYFENTKDIKSDLQKRISFYDFKNKNIEFLHTVGTK